MWANQGVIFPIIESKASDPEKSVTIIAELLHVLEAAL